MGTALVSTLGAASVEAVTATMSGNHQTGMSLIHQPLELLMLRLMTTTLLFHYLKLLMVV